MSDKLYEEAEKYIDDYLDMGCFKDPDLFRPALIEGYEFGHKSRDKEIKKLREALEDIMEYTKPPMRDRSGGCYYKAEKGLKDRVK